MWSKWVAHHLVFANPIQSQFLQMEIHSYWTYLYNIYIFIHKPSFSCTLFSEVYSDIIVLPSGDVDTFLQYLVSILFDRFVNIYFIFIVENCEYVFQIRFYEEILLSA